MFIIRISKSWWVILAVGAGREYDSRMGQLDRGWIIVGPKKQFWLQPSPIT